MRTIEGTPLKYLLAWIGRQDLDGARQTPPTGPIVDFLRVHPGAQAILLCDWPKDEAALYGQALKQAVENPIEARQVRLADPTDYLGIYRAADAALGEISGRPRHRCRGGIELPHKPIAANTLLLGEVGLAGEVRAVGQADTRVREGAKLGFTRCILPEASLRQIPSIDGVELCGVRSLADAWDVLF